jgi:hypothetical protein
MDSVSCVYVCVGRLRDDSSTTTTTTTTKK